MRPAEPRRARRAAALALGLAVLAAGCGGGPVEGVVVAKVYEPSERKVSCKRSGSKPKCRTRRDDEDFVLRLRTTDGRVVDREVSREVFEAAVEGQQVRVG